MSEHPAHDALRAYAKRLEAETAPGAVHRGVRRALRRTPVGGWFRRAAVVVASSLGLVMGNVALAVAVQPSVPGDVLYGVERAYERVASLLGFELGSPEERLAEAAAAAERGDPVEAKVLVTEALADVPPAVPVVEATPPEFVDDLIGVAWGVVEAAQTGDPAAVAEAVEEMQAELGPPVGVPGGGSPPDPEELPAVPASPPGPQGPVPGGAGPPDDAGPPSDTPGRGSGRP